MTTARTGSERTTSSPTFVWRCHQCRTQSGTAARRYAFGCETYTADSRHFELRATALATARTTLRSPFWQASPFGAAPVAHETDGFNHPLSPTYRAFGGAASGQGRATLTGLAREGFGTVWYVLANYFDNAWCGLGHGGADFLFCVLALQGP